MRERERPWSFPVTVDEIPETGRHFDLTADENTRAAIAALAGVEGIPVLRASFDVARAGHAGLAVTGTVQGEVDQICVVTLEPMRSAIAERVDVAFAPPSDTQGLEVRRIDLPADEEGPEPLIDGTIDLGALATEFLILAIDPYPRKDGAVFEAPVEGADPSEHPFAALAALKRGNAGGGQ
jgi:uncharacterized metal-binding protein YceD (DUF177 family)